MNLRESILSTGRDWLIIRVLGENLSKLASLLPTPPWLQEFLKTDISWRDDVGLLYHVGLWTQQRT